MCQFYTRQTKDAPRVYNGCDMRTLSRIVPLVFALAGCLTAQTIRVIPLSEAKQFRMGSVTSNRIIHPETGATKLTLNYSMSQPGHEFAQHVHDGSDDTIVILEGSADLRQGGARTGFRAGQSAWVPGGQIHGTITTGAGTAHMISFQTPPDLVLYTGARDSSLPGAAPPKGIITPGAVKYLDAGKRNGFFAHPGMGAERIAAAHRRLRPGERFTSSAAAGAEQALFIWKGAVTIWSATGKQEASERSGVFVKGPVGFQVHNPGTTDAVLIQTQAPPSPEWRHDGSFNGRWVIQSHGESAQKMFWLELSGAGTPTISGAFFGATGGRMARLLSPVIRDGELSFRAERTYEGTPPRYSKVRTNARLRNGMIEGSTDIDGRVYQWEGWRAPELPESDDGRWVAGPEIPLLDSTLSRWETGDAGRKADWKFEGGVLKPSNARPSLLVTKEEFWNFKVRFEFRLPPGGNAGVGLRSRYEVQLFDDHGRTPDVHGNGAIYSRIAARTSASKPPGEWQSIEATLIGREVSVVLNGVRTIDRMSIAGLCGWARDPHEERPGPLSLQGDHGPIEYRNIAIQRLTRQ